MKKKEKDVLTKRVKIEYFWSKIANDIKRELCDLKKKQHKEIGNTSESIIDVCHFSMWRGSVATLNKAWSILERKNSKKEMKKELYIFDYSALTTSEKSNIVKECKRDRIVVIFFSSRGSESCVRYVKKKFGITRKIKNKRVEEDNKYNKRRSGYISFSTLEPLMRIILMNLNKHREIPWFLLVELHSEQIFIDTVRRFGLCIDLTVIDIKETFVHVFNLINKILGKYMMSIVEGVSDQTKIIDLDDFNVLEIKNKNLKIKFY